MTENINIIAKYNFWNKNTLSLGYQRDFYCDKISEFIGNRLVKVLVGQRRVGKSYILRQITKRLIDQGVKPENILYINKEYTEFDFINTYSELKHFVEMYRNQLKPTGRVFLFIDEVQNIEGWERAVNSWSQDFTNEYEIFITGSNSNLLSGEMASFLSGRYVQFLILPFSFKEYCDVYKRPEDKLSYIEYLQTGALPELTNLPNEETKRHYVSAIKDTVLLRDIIQRNKIKDTKLLEDIFVFLIVNASNLISITNIINFFKSKNRKTNYETIANYIHFIKEAFLIYSAERYNIKGKETIAGNCKYYINDLSFVNYLYAGFGYGVGYKLENMVYLDLLRKGYQVHVGVTRDKEVDFVAINGERIIYIQCSYLLTDQATIQREYSALEAIHDNYEKFVVSMDDIKLPSKAGIKHIQAWKLSEYI